jgi:hypothetical protein
MSIRSKPINPVQEDIKMKKIFSMAMILVLVFDVLVGAQGASASGRTASWWVSIVYQNIGTAATPISIDFYEEDSSAPITFDPLNGATLGVYASASLYIGSVSGMADGFHGNAVVSASQPLAATIVQFSNSLKVRMLSTGFHLSDGSTKYMLSTVLNNKYGRTTALSIQNMGGTAVTATVHFYNADNNGYEVSNPNFTIPANSTKYIKLDDANDTGFTPPASDSFNGSAIVEVPDGSAVVTTASEMYTNLNTAANFEGVPQSRVGNTIYMASALCKKYGLSTDYAIQNTSTTQNANATVTITYKNVNGTTKTDGPYTIPPHQKISRPTCFNSTMDHFTGSAKITSTGAPLAVVGKAGCYDGVANEGCNDPTHAFDFVRTAFLGEADGASKLALPFIRWANNDQYNAIDNNGQYQRCSIAIQNLQTVTSTVNVEYYGKNGGSPLRIYNIVISPSSKGNSDPTIAPATLGPLGGMITDTFGYYPGGSFGGAVIVKANAANPTHKYVAIARCGHPGYGEDYNAVHIP